jgi:valyl-tRNA synthetase
VLEVAAAVVGEVRKAKSEAHQSMRAEVSRAVVTDTPERLAALRRAATDVQEAGRIADLVLEEGAALAVKIELAEG